MRANEQRIYEHIENLSQFTKTPGAGVTRLTYSEEDLQARNYIKEHMKNCGLTVTEDGFGNIFGKLEGTNPESPSVLIGSHFDSVPNGGAYDGTAGVVTGLEIAAMFQENRLTPTYPLEVIALVEEEGTRYKGGLMGSRGITGLVSREEFETFRDENGQLAIDAMKAIGLDSTKEQYRDPKTIKAFLELHIEQGPILEEKKIPIGIVTSIVGLAQLEVTVKGQAGHAGTTPMTKRKDALVSAAQVIASFPEIAMSISEETVITTGRLQVYPNGANVIPEEVVFTVDIRSADEVQLLHAIRQVKTLIEEKNHKEVQFSVKQPLYIEPKALDQDLQNLFKKASEQLEIPYYSMASGAGHDAMVFADVTASGMLFVPSLKGLSHCPEEYSDVKDLTQGTNILFEAIKQLTEAKIQ